MAKIELNWVGLKIFNEATINALDEGICGIYRIAYQQGDIAYVCFVGKTDDLKRQLLAHLEKDEPNICIRNYIQSPTTTCWFKYTEIADLSQRDIAYGLLYKFYQPACNTDKPIIDETFTINVN